MPNSYTALPAEVAGEYTKPLGWADAWPYTPGSVYSPGFPPGDPSGSEAEAEARSVHSVTFTLNHTTPTQGGAAMQVMGFYARDTSFLLKTIPELWQGIWTDGSVYFQGTTGLYGRWLEPPSNRSWNWPSAYNQDASVPGTLACTIPMESGYSHTFWFGYHFYQSLGAQINQAFNVEVVHYKDELEQGTYRKSKTISGLYDYPDTEVDSWLFFPLVHIVQDRGIVTAFEAFDDSGVQPT